jgi:amidase
MKRRTALQAAGIGAAALVAPLTPRAAAQTPIKLDPARATTASLARALRAGRTSVQAIAHAHLDRIAAIDRAGPRLNSIIECNPDALKEAKRLDQLARKGQWLGPLHGIPVLLKDNIATGDRMQTTAGSLALEGTHAPRDAHIVEQLRQAGALVLAKTNLSEWANIRSNRSTSGWSSRGGLTRNPYALDRNTSGSSSGTGAAIAAGLGVLGVGTETDGSIISPSTRNGLVGLKPTVGRVSRDGIIPISHTQDTAGPMTRTVADAAALLQAISAADPRDLPTQDAPPAPDYLAALKPEALQGVRIGVALNQLNPHMGISALFDRSLQALRQLGAELVDVQAPRPATWSTDELTVLLVELKAGVAAWITEFAPQARVRTLEDIIAFNEANATRVMPHFGQELFLQARDLGGLDSPLYKAALEKCRRLARTEGLEALFDKERIQALVAPSGGLASLTDLGAGDHSTGGFSSAAAVAGLPHLTVPMGMVGVQGGAVLPVGLSFVGPAWSEAALLGYGYAFEQAGPHRVAPSFKRHSTV